MRIRPLHQHEIKDAVKLIRLNYHSKIYTRRARHEIMSMFKHADAIIRPHYIVEEEGGKLLGFAGYTQSEFDYSVYEIFWVNVSPRYQHRGLGTVLVRKVIKIIKSKRGADKTSVILLTTTRPHFYKVLGFKTLLKLTHHYYLMALSLTR